MRLRPRKLSSYRHSYCQDLGSVTCCCGKSLEFLSHDEINARLQEMVSLSHVRSRGNYFHFYISQLLLKSKRIKSNIYLFRTVNSDG
jgi:hypothetical protein